MTTPLKEAATAIRVFLDPDQRTPHQRLQRKLARLRKSGQPLKQQGQALEELLNIAAPAKAAALAGIARHIRPDQETVIFCRNHHEMQLALQACQEAGKDTLFLDGTRDDSMEWEQNGGILLTLTKPWVKYPNLALARSAIHFGRPTSRKRAQDIQDQLNHRSRRRRLETTHIIAAGTADETVANHVNPNTH